MDIILTHCFLSKKLDDEDTLISRLLRDHRGAENLRDPVPAGVRRDGVQPKAGSGVRGQVSVILVV